jgi:GT2 family glycosyltransferase
MKDLAILIPSWSGPKLLDTCLLGIKCNCETNYDIIVTLNEVDEDSYAIAKKWGVKIITISENIGTMAVDMAIPLIRGKYKYVANLNNDMIVCPGWDRKLIEYY